jgi:hypothetical protein
MDVLLQSDLLTTRDFRKKVKDELKRISNWKNEIVRGVRSGVNPNFMERLQKEVDIYTL